MIRSGKIFRMLTAVCMLCAVTACGKKDRNEDLELTLIPSASPSAGTHREPEASYTPLQTKRITYYTLSESLENEETTAVLSESVELTPEYLVNYVVGTMEDVAVEVGIDSVTLEDGKVIVSFTAGKAPVCGGSAKLEEEILDAIAQSILENFPECTSVIYRLEGGAYKSENRSFELNYVYLGN